MPAFHRQHLTHFLIVLLQRFASVGCCVAFLHCALSIRPTNRPLTKTLSGAPSADSALVNAMPTARLTAVGAPPAVGLCAGVQDVDDAAKLALAHAREYRTAKANRSKYLEVQIRLPLLVGNVSKRCALGGACVVDQNVDSAKLSFGLRDCVCATLGHADVCGDSNSVTTSSANGFGAAVNGPSVRATMATRAPAAANVSLIALPIPALAPVTRAIRLRNLKFNTHKRRFRKFEGCVQAYLMRCKDEKSSQARFVFKCPAVLASNR